MYNYLRCSVALMGKAERAFAYSSYQCEALVGLSALPYSTVAQTIGSSVMTSELCGEVAEHLISVNVTTLTGSITGQVKLLKVDSSLTIHEFKLLVQREEHDFPEEWGPKRRTINGVTTDYQRVFLGENELVTGEETLQNCGIKEYSDLVFGVGKSLGENSGLRCLPLTRVSPITTIVRSLELSLET